MIEKEAFRIFSWTSGGRGWLRFMVAVGGSSRQAAAAALGARAGGETTAAKAFGAELRGRGGARGRGAEQRRAGRHGVWPTGRHRGGRGRGRHLRGALVKGSYAERGLSRALRTCLRKLFERCLWRFSMVFSGFSVVFRGF